MTSFDDDVESAFRALASDRRLLILEWLKRPKAHFPPQVDGDLVKDGVCGVLIAEKLGVSQPTVSEHLKILSQAGLAERQAGQAVDILQARRSPHRQVESGDARKDLTSRLARSTAISGPGNSGATDLLRFRRERPARCVPHCDPFANCVVLDLNANPGERTFSG